MALGSHAQWSFYHNLLTNPTREQNKLASPQGLAKRSDIDSNKALTLPKIPTPPEAPISPLVLSIKDFFMKFMKIFVESTQVWD